MGSENVHLEQGRGNGEGRVGCVDRRSAESIICATATDGAADMVYLIGFFVLLLIAIIPAAIGHRKGYNFFEIWLLSVLFLPILAIAILLVPSYMKCPYCLERIRSEASACRHCGRWQLAAANGRAATSLVDPFIFHHGGYDKGPDAIGEVRARPVGRSRLVSESRRIALGLTAAVGLIVMSATTFTFWPTPPGPTEGLRGGVGHTARAEAEADSRSAIAATQNQSQGAIAGHGPARAKLREGIQIGGVSGQIDARKLPIGADREPTGGTNIGDNLLGETAARQVATRDPISGGPVHRAVQPPSDPDLRRTGPSPDPSMAVVADVQLLLVALGYKPGLADGVLGRQTRSAISKFQAETSVTPDGRVTDALLLALAAASKVKEADNTVGQMAAGDRTPASGGEGRNGSHRDATSPISLIPAGFTLKNNAGRVPGD